MALAVRALPVQEATGQAEALSRFHSGAASAISRLSPRQRDVFWAIVWLTPQLGRGPTRAELGDAVGLSLVTVDRHVNRLRAAGLIDARHEDANRSRLPLPYPEGHCAACGSPLPA
jgi:DNA-binding transcriptional ArsR family regulator